MRLRIKDTAVTLQVIGWLQITGGITGLGLMGYILYYLGTISGPVLLLLLIGISLFCFSIYAGKRLVTDRDKKTGIILSLINQLVQVFQFCLGSIGLTYSSGVEFVIGVQGTSLKFHGALITSNFQMFIRAITEESFKVNLAAVLVLATLLSILQEQRDKKNC